MQNGLLAQTVRRNVYRHEMDLPKYSGKEEENLTHYFIKLQLFMRAYNINSNEDIIATFIESLEGEAMDLYLSFDISKRGDISYLEHRFKDYFKPTKHWLVEMLELLKITKGHDESMSEFILKIRQKSVSSRFSIDLLKAVFVQGIPFEYQQHLALQNLQDLKEMFKACVKLEHVLEWNSRLKQVNSGSS